MLLLQTISCAQENKKVAAALKHDLVVVFCVGETLEQRENGKTEEVIKGQLVNGLKGFTAEQLKDMVVAYEPVWAIGTGKTATPEQAQETHKAIRAVLAEMFGKDFADAVRILYGGSVKADNVDAIMASIEPLPHTAWLRPVWSQRL